MLTSDSVDRFRLLDVDNRLCLPCNVNSMVIITSADVLHSWTVPSLGVKADAIPGRLNYLRVTPCHYGVFYGQCSELCGSNHSFIPIVVESTKVSALLNYIIELRRDA
jgi:cytochrome c oxidase subunit 2